VLRVAAGDDVVFFKANAPGFEHEAHALVVLGPLAADLLPDLVEVDRERGWMLLRDAGVRLREHPDAARWDDVLTRYADLQQAAAPEAARLVAAGVPDCTLQRLPELYEQLGGRDVATVCALCDELAAFGVPETIQHDDLHDGQVFARDGRARILDWGDSCVSHPFMTFAVTLPFAADALDAYLARWDAYGGPARLRDAVPLAMRLGGVSRAQNWARVLQCARGEWLGHDEAWLERVGAPPDEWT
jgi:hypothetical protein